MAIVTPKNRIYSNNLTAVKGVNFDLKKMEKDLSSKIIDIPTNQNIEERSLWLQKMMNQRKALIQS